MRFSNVFPKTRREDPSGDASPGTRLLLRAGLIDQVASGIWIMTPLGLRVQDKVEVIVRQEMNAAGAVELRLPILQPYGLWEETGRLQKYLNSGTAFSTRDRKDGDLMLAPTAEEVITAFARRHLTSWRSLPMNLYQLSPKFRDELRPRQGLIRGREFVMKDAYSFDIDEAGMRASYEIMRQAYQRVFERCGFDFLAVDADSGAIGGSGSAEFMAVTEYGEDVLLHCRSCGYGANQEKAVTSFHYDEVEPEELQQLPTPDIKTVEELEGFTDFGAAQMVKTIVMLADNKPVIVSVRGDLTISEVKLCNLLGLDSVDLVGKAPDEIVEAVTGAPVGFAGPIGLYGQSEFNDEPVPYFFDHSVQGMQNFLCGGNEEDLHYIGVNTGRDFPAPEHYEDLTNVEAGHACPNCGGVLDESRGIELGHIFQLQQVYSQPMGATFVNQDDKPVPFWMGCYGIGVSRIVQAIVEQRYDDKGICWPVQLAPYEIVVAPASKRQLSVAEEVYTKISRAFPGEVMFDDRGARFGVMAADADLIGYPLRVVVGRDWDDSSQEIEVTIRDANGHNGSDDYKQDRRGSSQVMPLDHFTSWWRMQRASGSAFNNSFL